MTAARPENSERAVAAGVLLTAVTIALWIVLHRTPQAPLPALRIAHEETEAAPPQSAPAQPSNPAALAFEIVELPPAPQPHAAPQPAPAPPRPQPVTPRVETPRVEPPKPIVSPKPEEPPAASIVPLRPEPERPGRWSHR